LTLLTFGCPSHDQKQISTLYFCILANKWMIMQNESTKHFAYSLFAYRKIIYCKVRFSNALKPLFAYLHC